MRFNDLPDIESVVDPRLAFLVQQDELLLLPGQGPVEACPEATSHSLIP